MGKVAVRPGAVNAIPALVTGWLDARGADADAVRALVAELSDQVSGLGGHVDEESWTPPTRFDADLVQRLSQALGGAPVLGTGAGHDAGILAASGITAAMLFVRNPTGVSHSPDEWAEPSDCLAGVQALTDGAGRPGRSGDVTSYWAAYAWLPTGVRSAVRFRIRDGQFAELRSGEPPSPGDERLTGLVLPGLANGHSHAFHRALRGRTQAGTGTFWTWRTQMYEVAQQLDPDSYRQLARAVYAEMVLAGYTAVGEFHYLHHDRGGRRYAEPNAMGQALIEAAADAGIRLTLLDTCYLAGGLDADGHLPLDEVQQRFSDGNADAWAVRMQDLRPTERVQDRGGGPLGAGGSEGVAGHRGPRGRRAAAARAPQ